MPKLLIIDDNLEFSKMIYDFFSSLGYQIETVNEPEKAVAFSRIYLPDLIFLDVMMPGKNGIEIIRELQNYEETAKIPVFILTATYFEKQILDLFKMEPNCKEFLNKSIDILLLKKKVEEILKK